MNPKEKANELIDKFNCNAIEVLKETILIWKIKRDIQVDKLNKGNRSDCVLNAISVCNRTLNYWYTVKNIINNK